MFFLNNPVLQFTFFLGLASSLYAQPIDKCANRTVTVNVRDRQGYLITGLTQSSFRATIHGQMITVASADMEVGPRVVLLLDVSGSIISFPAKWKTVKLVSENLIASSRNSFRVALMLFASDVVETLDFGHSGREILQRLQQLADGEKLVPKGKRQTALLDSVLRALTLFGRPEPGDTVFVITDGEDNASRVHTTKVEEALAASGVRFFAVTLHDVHSPLAEDWGEDILADLAKRTGGGVLDVYSPPTLGAGSQVEISLEKVYDQIARFYRLVLEPVKNVDTEQRWDLEVVDGQGKRRKDLNVMYPGKLAACVECE
jgi:hypothetical protein